MGHRIVRTLLYAGMLVVSDLTLAAQDKTALILLEVKDVTGASVANGQVQILPLPGYGGKKLNNRQRRQMYYTWALAPMTWL